MDCIADESIKDPRRLTNAISLLLNLGLPAYLPVTLPQRSALMHRASLASTQQQHPLQYNHG